MALLEHERQAVVGSVRILYVLILVAVAFTGTLAHDVSVATVDVVEQPKVGVALGHGRVAGGRGLRLGRG